MNILKIINFNILLIKKIIDKLIYKLLKFIQTINNFPQLNIYKYLFI